MGSFGETLRQARLDKGVSLSEAEQEIRVRRRYLEALENEDFSSLPAPVYARGMIRTYARYLGLPPDSMVDLFQAARPREERLMIRPATPSVPQSLSISVRSLVMVGGAIAVVVLLAVAWSQYNSLAETIERAEEQQQAANTLVPVDSPLAAAEATPTPESTPTPAPPTPTPAPPTPTVVPTPVEGVVVEARLRSSTWVEVWVDEQKVAGETIEAGTTRLFEGERSVRMLVADGAAVEVVENGVERGLLDADGRAVEARWTRG